MDFELRNATKEYYIYDDETDNEYILLVELGDILEECIVTDLEGNEIKSSTETYKKIIEEYDKQK